MSIVALFGRSPDAAVLSCVLGIFLIYTEFNRPGAILPGATGLLLVLLGVAGFAQHSLNTGAVICLLLAAALLLGGLRRHISWSVGAAATMCIVAGCRNLIRVADGPQIHLLAAILAGLLLGPGTLLLTAIARRARVNKGLD